MLFSEKILQWYHANKRDLPWRKTRDPYKIWLSEIMLQQTRVTQGLPYYEKFVQAFPSVNDMAAAEEQEVLKLWQGLGYYSRARNMHATAKTIVEDYGSRFPSTYLELLKLKGVGDYTASAISSMCFGEPEPVVDGNVYRVLARYFGIDLPINSTQGIKYFKKLAREVKADRDIRDYNQGIMEFGAVQCSPKNPNCGDCPLSNGCRALQENRVEKLPVKLKKNSVKKRFFNYLVFLDVDGRTALEQRTHKGIWQNLYQFPLVETENELGLLEEKLILNRAKEYGKVSSIGSYNQESIIHKLSHQHLYTKFWIVHLHDALDAAIDWKNLGDYPVPVLIADFIKSFKF